MLTKTERDGARLFCADALGRCITWNEADKISRIAINALDALDVQDAEVSRLTAENDRLIVIAKADEWQARYWAEHDAVADREATIMAEQAKVAAMRLCLVRQGCACREGNAAEGESPHKCFRCETLESNDAGAELLKRRAEELQGWWDKTKTMAADLAAVVARKDLELAAYRKAAHAVVAKAQIHSGAWIGVIAGEIANLDEVLQSPDPGKALVDAHAAEIQKAAREWLHLDAARTMLMEERDTLKVEHAAELEKMRNIMHEALDRTIRRGEAIIALRAESNDRLNKIEFLEGRLLSLRQRAEHWEKSFCEALKRAEAADANLIEARKAAEGHREPCYYCGKPTNNLSAFPGEWSVGLCHGDDPGRLRWHHVSCVSERLARLEAAEKRAPCDGSTERSHTESTKAAIAALWETNPEIAYESPAQVIAWLKGRAEAAELFRATFERPRGLRSGQCCDPVIDGEICALLRRVEAAEAALAKIAARLNITPESDIALLLDVRLKRYERDSNVSSAAELRRAVFDLRAELRAMADRLAERALGGEGK